MSKRRRVGEPSPSGILRPPAPSGALRAMVLAAGRGLRMRPITATIPKPLIPVAGRTLLDRTLDRLDEVGVKEVVVNAHHLGEQIESHLKARERPRCIVSFEPEPLETGGGVARALPLIGAEPFFVCNSDIILLNGPRPALANLAAAWDEATMDALLLLHRTVAAQGYEGAGDFFMDQGGHLCRRQNPHHAPYLFTGIQILHPRLFADAPEGAFSLNVLYDRAIAARRLHGLVHDGQWFHIGRPWHLAAVADGLAPQRQSVPLA